MVRHLVWGEDEEGSIPFHPTKIDTDKAIGV